MDTVVGKLLEIDRQARQIMDEAQQYHDQTLEELEGEKRRIEESYCQNAQQHIEQVRQFETDVAQERQTEIQARYSQLVLHLETNYEANHEAWEQELFHRCISGGE